MKPDLGGERVTVQVLNPVELGQEGGGGHISWLGGPWIKVRGLDCPWSRRTSGVTWMPGLGALDEAFLLGGQECTKQGMWLRWVPWRHTPARVGRTTQHHGLAYSDALCGHH